MKNFRYIILITLIVILLPGLALSHGKKKPNVVKIVVEEAYHHIGDGYVAGFIIYNNEGTFWESTFKVKRWMLKKYSYAYVKFFCHDLDGAHLVVNGYRFSLNQSNERPNGQHLIPYLVPIDINILYPGKNTIGFEVDELGGNNLDDMEFGEVEVWFQ